MITTTLVASPSLMRVPAGMHARHGPLDEARELLAPVCGGGQPEGVAPHAVTVERRSPVGGSELQVDGVGFEVHEVRRLSAGGVVDGMVAFERLGVAGRPQLHVRPPGREGGDGVLQGSEVALALVAGDEDDRAEPLLGQLLERGSLADAVDLAGPRPLVRSPTRRQRSWRSTASSHRRRKTSSPSRRRITPRSTWNAEASAWMVRPRLALVDAVGAGEAGEVPAGLRGPRTGCADQPGTSPRCVAPR